MKKVGSILNPSMLVANSTLLRHMSAKSATVYKEDHSPQKQFLQSTRSILHLALRLVSEFERNALVRLKELEMRETIEPTG